jgi:fucose permease
MAASVMPVLFRQPPLYLLGLMLFLYVASEVGVFNWLVKYLEEERTIAREDAQNILSWGFALGLLVGRVVASRILLGVSEIKVTLVSSAVMVMTTFAMVRVEEPILITGVVFAVGAAMAPIFPTTLGVCGNLFPKMTATAMGVVITSGWAGLTLSSYVIGFLADRSSLSSALLLLPAMSLALVGVNLALKPYVDRARHTNAS